MTRRTGGAMRGLTLLELLVVLTITAILAAMAAPSFSGLLASARVSQAVNALMSDMRYVRGEGLRRGKPITICRSASPTMSVPVCSSGDGKSTGGWMEGWVVFVDDDGDGKFETGDTVIRVQQALPGLADLLAVDASSAKNPVNNRNSFTFDAMGRAMATPTRWLVHAPGPLASDSTYTRTLCLNFVGRLRVLKGEADCN